MGAGRRPSSCGGRRWPRAWPALGLVPGPPCPCVAGHGVRADHSAWSSAWGQAAFGTGRAPGSVAGGRVALVQTAPRGTGPSSRHSSCLPTPLPRRPRRTRSPRRVRTLPALAWPGGRRGHPSVRAAPRPRAVIDACAPGLGQPPAAARPSAGARPSVRPPGIPRTTCGSRSVLRVCARPPSRL